MSCHEDELGFTKAFEDLLRQAVDDCVGIITSDDHLSSKVRLVSLAPFDTARNQNAQPIVKYVGDLGKELEKAREGLGYSEKEIEKNAKKLFSTFLRSMPQSFVKGQIFLFEPNSTLIACNCDKSKKKTYCAKDLAVLGRKFGVDYAESDIDEMVRYQVQTLGAHDVGFHLPVLFADDAELTSAAYYWAGEKSTLLYTLVSVVASPRDYDEVIDIAIKLRDSLARLSYLLFQRVTLVFGHKLQVANIHSAIGSIMSRNGSHNIGSHVLSALSHNVGTMPDDRILYQYIQHRMDYIASATTGAPDWSVPTPFVGSVMKMFYSQRHLLDHIAESDGLHAYQYQGKGTLAGDAQKNCVKIVVRKIKKGVQPKKRDGWHFKQCADGSYIGAYEFFSDADGGETIGINDEDMSIPGGVLGQQAFYNIIENIVRNAAKHSWAGKSDDERNAVGNLEIYVDFETRDEDGMVCFTVGDNMSRLFLDDFWSDFFRKAKLPKKRKRESLAFEFSRSLDGECVLPKTAKKCETMTSARYAVEEFLRGNGDRDSLPWFYQVLYDYINENRDTLLSDASFRALLKVKESEKTSQETYASLEHRLPLPLHHQQEIELAKPFIDTRTGRLRQSSWGLSEMKISAGYLRRAAISVIGGIEDEVGKHPLIVPVGIPKTGQDGKLDYQGLRLAYRFWIKIPKDVLIMADAPSKWGHLKSSTIGVESYSAVMGNDAQQKKGDIGKMSDYGFVIVDHDGEIGADELKLPFRSLRIGTFNGLPCISANALLGAKTRDELVSLVYKAWLDYLKQRRGKSPEHKLTIKLHIYDERGGEKGLISDRDIYKVLFRECLHSILEPIVDDIDGRMTPVQRKALLLISLYPLSDNDELFSNVPERFDDSHRCLMALLLGKIAAEVQRFLSALPCASRGNCFMVKHLARTYEAGLERAKETMGDESVAQDLLAFLNQHNDSSRESSMLQDELHRMELKPLDSEIIGLAVDALDVARTTSDVFLRKYEERIVTLPKQYKGLTTSGKGSLDFYKKLGVHIVYGGHVGDADISYNRHATDNALLYSEPLSGSQTYLNALANLTDKDEAWAMRLAENGLIRIVVIDERVRAFVVEHGEEIRKTYESMHIAVVDTERKPEFGADGMLPAFKDKAWSYVAGGSDDPHFDPDFDLVVIHQGIIDKWWSDHSQGAVSDILKRLRTRDGSALGRFVVVTTGRGRPDNIPENAKVLAFSSIETFLFKRYPEKLNLVNSLMSILPGSPERKDEND